MGLLNCRFVKRIMETRFLCEYWRSKDARITMLPVQLSKKSLGLLFQPVFEHSLILKDFDLGTPVLINNELEVKQVVIVIRDKLICVYILLKLQKTTAQLFTSGSKAFNNCDVEEDNA